MTLSGQTYLCSAGETFDMVALTVYGDEKYSCYILCANPSLCETQVFAGGEILQLPVVEIDEDDGEDDDEEDYISPDAPWKE